MSAAEAQRLNWATIVEDAARIVRSYDTPVTLRQLHYRLVSAELIPNTATAYKTLSDRTTRARRRGEFPQLMDEGRKITRALSFNGVEDACAWLAEVYRRDRTEGQDVSVYLGLEKAGLVAQLDSWFGEERGIPIFALRGYHSESFEREIRRDIAAGGRPAVLIYAGDFDPSGEDILRNFLHHVPAFDEVVHVALTADQVDAYDLPPQLGKATDSRASAFVEKYGRLVQVELDALPPDVLRALFAEAIEEFWDESAFEHVRLLENHDLAELLNR